MTDIEVPIGLPKIHPRVFVERQAASEIEVAMWEVVDRHGLTYSELLRILGTLVGTAADLAVRLERHGPDSTKRTDEL